MGILFSVFELPVWNDGWTFCNGRWILGLLRGKIAVGCCPRYSRTLSLLDSNADHTAVATIIPMFGTQICVQTATSTSFQAVSCDSGTSSAWRETERPYNNAELPAAGREVSELPSAEEATPGDKQVHDEMHT